MIRPLVLAAALAVAAVPAVAGPATAGTDCTSCHGTGAVPTPPPVPYAALGATPAVAEDAHLTGAQARVAILGVVYAGPNHAVGVAQGATTRTVGVNHSSVEMGLWAPEAFDVPAGCRALRAWRAHGSTWWGPAVWTGYGPVRSRFTVGLDMSVRLVCDWD